MNHIHFDLIMTVMREERKQRARDRKFEQRMHRYRGAQYAECVREMSGEIEECDHDIEAILSKYA